MYPISLHIFRRDLRLQDNNALIEALKSSEYVIPCFVFDKRQIENNPYKSDNCIQFMVNSLLELDAALKKKNSKLYLFYGIAEEIVTKLLTKLNIKAVFINRDYTPFSKVRDQKIEKICHDLNVDFHCYADALLHEPEQLLKDDNQPYSIFTHFLKKANQLHVQSSKINKYNNYYQQAISFENRDIIKTLLKINNPNIFMKGGRNEGLSLLKKIKNLQDYQTNRNLPALESTTKLSAHNKFGTISIREFYEAVIKDFGSNHTLITELYWRDFFTYIIYFYPQVLGNPFRVKYANIVWENNEKKFKAWCNGLTGFPIVDAGMRQLNATGYMHNRVRMITASFLIKDLHIDWQWGEKYFANKLIDYDPAVNNGNWQWVASTGCDAQPFFRILNPWLQQQKFDFDCVYIKKWIPELSTISAKQIHLFNKKPITLDNYPNPIVNHTLEQKKCRMQFTQ